MKDELPGNFFQLVKIGNPIEVNNEQKIVKNFPRTKEQAMAIMFSTRIEKSVQNILLNKEKITSLKYGIGTGTSRLSVGVPTVYFNSTSETSFH